MEAVIRKWGNRPALRLPTSALKEAGSIPVGTTACAAPMK